MNTADYKQLSDEELIALLKRSDGAAYSELYRRYWSGMYVYARKILHDEEDAEDAVQEVLTYIWTKREVLKINGSPEGYLYGAVRFRAFAMLQRTKTFDRYLDSLTDFMDKGEYTTDEQVREKELIRGLDKAVAALPAKMRKIFELSRTGLLNQKGIAAQLNISNKTVKNQLSTALKIIRNKIKPILIVVMTFFL